MRGVSLVLVLSMLLATGCASSETGLVSEASRSTAVKVLIGVALGTAAVALGAGLAGRSVKNGLADDVQAGAVTADEFNDKDAKGERWNRVMRSSLFVTGLSIIGLGVVWEMGEGAAMRRERTTANLEPPGGSRPPAMGHPSGASLLPPTPVTRAERSPSGFDVTAQSSATAR
jgi:hypothetical protein